MERLTVYTPDGYESINPVDLCLDEYSDINFERILDKLGKYEDLEEQGRLPKLPCKVGDDVYYILGIPNETPCAIDKRTFELSDINKIGKTLFLTKPKAEAKLKELRGA